MFPPTIHLAADRLLAATSAHAVILFGSRARGDAHPDSDWNLAVILPDATAFGEWTPSTMGKLVSGLGESFTVVAFRHFVYEQARRNPGTVSAAVAEEGILLAGSPAA